VHFYSVKLIPFHFADISAWRLDCNKGNTYEHVRTMMADALMLPTHFIVLLTWAFAGIGDMSAPLRCLGRVVRLRAEPSLIAQHFNNLIFELKGWQRSHRCRVCAGFYTHRRATVKKRARPDTLTGIRLLVRDEDPRTESESVSDSSTERWP
jgi:hypothetical protein